MKGCLKQCSPEPSPALEPHIRKCVAFGAAGSDVVYIADEWDRTPTEPARKLSYQDMLELKEIQRSLPRANQPPDPITGKPASQFLSAVPIGLLPLLPDSDSGSQDSSYASSPVSSPMSTPPNWGSPLLRANDLAPSARIIPKAWHPPHLAHLPSIQPPARQKPSFSFLPLLETPPPSAASSPYPSRPTSRSPSPDHHYDTDQSSQDPPTPSLTNASLDSSPPSRASSPSSEPEPSFIQLPPPHRRLHHPQHHAQHDRPRFSQQEGYYARSHFHPHDSYFPLCSEKASPSRSDAGLFLPSLLSPPTPPQPSCKGSLNADVLAEAKPLKRRSFILVNDVEIEVDNDDEEDDVTQTLPTPPSSSSNVGASHVVTKSSTRPSPPPSPTRRTPTPQSSLPTRSSSGASPFSPPSSRIPSYPSSVSPSPSSSSSSSHTHFLKFELNNSPSPSNSPTPPSSPPTSSSPFRARGHRDAQLQPPSPILAPYSLSMAACRRRSAGDDSSAGLSSPSAGAVGGRDGKSSVGLGMVFVPIA